MAKIDTKTVQSYIELKKEVPNIIKNSGMVQKFIYDKIEMSRATWTNKLKDGTFTENEILAIAKVINN